MKISIVVFSAFCALVFSEPHGGGYFGGRLGGLGRLGGRVDDSHAGAHVGVGPLDIGANIKLPHIFGSGSGNTHPDVETKLPKFYKTIKDPVFWTRQKNILSLFYRANQPSTNAEHIEIAKTFSPFDDVTLYNKTGIVETFHQYWKYSLLPKGKMFSVYNPEHLKQVRALFMLFYYANNYDVFYKTAIWARQFFNEELFTYTLTVAVVHRWDTKHIMLPPMHEICPHFFFNADVISKAQYYKQIHVCDKSGKSPSVYTVVANYSGNYLNVDPEQTALSYYLEDVGINSFFYLFHIHFPFWIGSEELGITNFNRGRFYYFVYQYLLTRYFLEGVSHGRGDIPYLNWDLPVETPYYSSQVHPNGLQIPSRPKFAKLHEYFFNYGQNRWASSVYGYSYFFVNEYERRIYEAIDSGKVLAANGTLIDFISEEGFNMLGNMIEGNRDTPNFRYYGAIWMYARHLLGYSTQPITDEDFVPSALELVQTQARDPVFYQLIKKLIVIPFQKYLERIPPYTEQELKFPGVKITNVEFDPIYTYNEEFYSNLLSSVFYNPTEPHGDFIVRVRQERLNHMPFNYKIQIKSDKAQKATIKMFIGPKYDQFGRHIDIKRNRLNFAQFQHFIVDLKAGLNDIPFSSLDDNLYASEKISTIDLYEAAVAAGKANGEGIVNLKQNYFGFPERFIVPKGSIGGTPYQFFFAVYPCSTYAGTQHHQLQELLLDGHPFTYPLDRFIEFHKMFERIPNFYFKEVKIYFKESEDEDAKYE